MVDSSDWQRSVAESEVDGSITVGLVVVVTSGAAAGATVGTDCKVGLGPEVAGQLTENRHLVVLAFQKHSRYSVVASKHTPHSSSQPCRALQIVATPSKQLRPIPRLYAEVLHSKHGVGGMLFLARQSLFSANSVGQT